MPAQSPVRGQARRKKARRKKVRQKKSPRVVFPEVVAPGIAVTRKKALSPPSFAIHGKNLERFRSALLRWYDRHRRALPWRQTRDPYAIWLSEIMLQQTRVAAVLEHYRIFLARFPNVEALAASSEDQVLAAWSGLGYYQRARRLHQCARRIVAQHGGSFPPSSNSLLTLPGIGRYTAAAIASIAFAEPVAVVDGNVERVLRRITGAPLTAPRIWQHAQALLDSLRPGDFNQAIMELGATVCSPRAPRCPVCPLRQWCATQGELPQLTTPARQQRKQIWCMLEHTDAGGHGRTKVRLVQRPRHDSLMPGMWELPASSEPPHSESAPWRTFRHSITVTDYTVHVFRTARLAKSPAAGWLAPAGRWIAADRIPQLPITGLTRKILRAGGII